MDKCKNCQFGSYEPIPDEQIGHKGQYLENWECEHPNPEIRKKSLQKGWSIKCPGFEKKVE